MATQSPNLVLDIAAISVRLLEAQEVGPRARTVARDLAALLPASAVNVYLLSETDEGEVWTVYGTVGDAAPDETVPSMPALSAFLPPVATRSCSPAETSSASNMLISTSAKRCSLLAIFRSPQMAL